MNIPFIYRKRLIPSECFLLKDDTVLYRDEDMIITKWDTLRPKKDLDHGLSCYFLKKNIKLSKFYDRQHHLLCWYCDIISTTWDAQTDTYTVTDLLADVIVYPDGYVKVLDLDELADAYAAKLLTEEELQLSLRRTNWLLSLIYSGRFHELQRVLKPYH